MSILQILKPKIYDITILASYTCEKRCKTKFIIIHNIAIYKKNLDVWKGRGSDVE